MSSPRVGQALGAALADAFDHDAGLMLLGEDVSAPYGGAFKITADVASRYPHRVRNTPISEAGILGVAAGLALMGRRPIVEIMFGDFAGLAFDQILNLATKSVTMYGSRVAMPVVVRCPTGARRGYGPTHSQSVQKHFVGIPNLALYELSPVHSADQFVAEVLARDTPTMLFEDKVLYTERIFPGHPGDNEFLLERSGGWAHVVLRGEPARQRVALITPGGVTRRAMDAARTLNGLGITTDVLVPACLYPFRPGPVLDKLASADSVWVAEESTAGGTWGSEVARVLHEQHWDLLRRPVRTLSSLDSVIPAARHLERRVIIGTADIVAALRSASRSTSPVPDASPTPPVLAEEPDRVVNRLIVPKLNNNDDIYLLVHWLIEDGKAVEVGDPVCEIETSKAVQEIESTAVGLLRHEVAVGNVCRPGDRIASILTPGTNGTPPRAEPVTTCPAGSAEPPSSDDLITLPAGQRRVAAVVARSHREIPAAFAAIHVDTAAAHARAAALSRECAAEIGLTELTLSAIGSLRSSHPMLFTRPTESGQAYRVARTADIAVTVDVGTGLSMPVIRDVAARDLADIADILTELRMKALRQRLLEDDLADPAIGLSLAAPGITYLHPLVPPGLSAIVSLAADDDGRSATIGLAHDHRIVNGREAMSFLGDLKSALQDPSRIVGDCE